MQDHTPMSNCWSCSLQALQAKNIPHTPLFTVQFFCSVWLTIVLHVLFVAVAGVIITAFVGHVGIGVE